MHVNQQINNACNVLTLYGYHANVNPNANNGVIYRKGSLEFRLHQIENTDKISVTVPLDSTSDYRVTIPTTSNLAQYVELHLKALHLPQVPERATVAFVKEDGDMSDIYSFVYEAYY